MNDVFAHIGLTREDLVCFVQTSGIALACASIFALVFGIV